MEEELTKDTGEQENIKDKRLANLLPYQYKKGQSGNPAGRPKGISLKEYAKLKLLHMTDEEREEFFHGLPKDKIWEMAEGKAESKTDITSGGQPITWNEQKTYLNETLS
jgi:hypothetical protein